jgi:quinoprotein glucose dehydrogenase
MNSLYQKNQSVVVVIFILLFAISCSEKPDDPYRSWTEYKGDAGSNSYSELNQINRDNVDQLEVAWVYNSGDKDRILWRKSISQANPVIIDGVMYFTSPAIHAVALDAATGEMIWRFDPWDGEDGTGRSRGVMYWEDGDDKRILFTAGFYLYALDAETGSLITSFGDNGLVDMRKGLDRNPENIHISVTSPGRVFGDLLIMGSTVTPAPGHIRAYNIRTGNIEWIFNTIPYPGEYGYETWGETAWLTAGGANNWAGMSLDREREMVFIPTASPDPAWYGGGDRIGENLFGNSVIALDANTGERIWHYQAIRHDIWDWDLPAPPNLVTVEIDGERTDAVAQVTKHGFVFVLDRDTGEPLFPVEEQSVPDSYLDGEEAWPTQPFPVKPAPFTRQFISEDDLSDISPEANEYARNRFENLRYQGLFTPVGEQETLFFPGTQGGANWGGASFDPETGILYINANEIGHIFSMRKAEQSPAEEVTVRQRGEQLASLNCMSCHSGSQSSDIPSLANIDENFSVSHVENIIQTGIGMMPAFTHLSDPEREAIVTYLFELENGEEMFSDDTQSQEEQFRYVTDTSWEMFLDENEYPATKPPWGTFNAIDLNTGERVWRVPLGEYPELTEQGVPVTGTYNLGGSVVTAGGLVFIGATRDEMFRAFDKSTGEILWEYKLPAGGYATPSTYEIDGKQYVIIAATGGGFIGTDTGDAFIAFSLPE